MLRHLQKPTALLMFGCFLSLSAFAQSAKKNPQKTITKDETVIIRNANSGGRTVIEIKDGTVYVNGRSIMSVRDADATRVHKKIIVENRPGSQSPQLDPWDEADASEFPDMPNLMGAPRAELGVMTQDASGRQGVVVKEVLPGSAAETAGLKKGDIITRVDGKIVANAAALVQTIRNQHQAGDEVTIRYERLGQEYNTKARLGQNTATAHSPQEPGYGYPQELLRYHPFGQWNPFADAPSYSPGPKLGATVEDQAAGPGVNVLQVKPGSPAAQAGLQSQDIIQRMNGNEINSVDELQAALNALQPGAQANLQIMRAGKEMELTAELPKLLHRKEL